MLHVKSRRSLTVAIIQRILPEYRVKFFERLAQSLSEQGVDFTLFYGQEFPGEVPVTCKIERTWAVEIVNRYLKFGLFRVIWQPALLKACQADLVIIEQSNSLLLNYFFLFLRLLRFKKVAFWGHGRNLQATQQNAFSEKIKQLLIPRVDWWFAYTVVSVELVSKTGFPIERITNVQNTIDTEGFQQALDRVDPSQLARLRDELGINSPNVLLYCGRMTAGKGLDFLLDTLVGVKAHVPDLHVLFVGGGPQEQQIRRFSNQHPWAHFIGPKFGEERAIYFRLSKALTVPSHLGLVVIDSLIAGTPVITTTSHSHGPEIAYLESGYNGRISESNLASYVRAISDFLESPAEQERLRDGCLKTSGRYSLNAMVRNFHDGIVHCLGRGDR